VQFSSGSSSDPKGVLISHENLMANQRAIAEAFGHGPDTVVAGWLPFFHDMGLLGIVFQPLFLGVPCVLLSTTTFLMRPMRWLEAISRYRATTSGAPNFAYQFCASRACAGPLPDVDLSSWRVAFCGAEPIRPDTMRRFDEVFRPRGFRRTSLFPRYGLAESALFVTGSLRQAFEEESFHADPHAGNLVILENNVIGSIDFGITGQLDEAFRSNQLLIFNAIQQGNLESYARGLLRLFEPPPEDTDIEGFKEEVKKNARRWFTNLYNPKCDLKERSIAFLLTGNFALARRYGLTYGQLAVRYYRALLVMELIVLRLDPGFDFRVELRTFFTRYGLRGILRDRAPSRVLLEAFRFRNFVRRFPDLAVNVVELVDREISTVRTELSSVKVFASRFFKMASIAAIVLSVVIIASTIIWPGFLRQAMGVNPLWVCVLLGMLALFSAWVARQLSNRSVRRGVYTSR
jgi:acyl-CoA synthetase (AMP-forming)/AMP-acid ligase II